MKECLLLVFANKQDLPDGEPHYLTVHCYSNIADSLSSVSSNDPDRSDRKIGSVENERSFLVLSPFERPRWRWSFRRYDCHLNGEPAIADNFSLAIRFELALEQFESSKVINLPNPTRPDSTHLTLSVSSPLSFRLSSTFSSVFLFQQEYTPHFSFRSSQNHSTVYLDPLTLFKNVTHISLFSTFSKQFDSSWSPPLCFHFSCFLLKLSFFLLFSFWLPSTHAVDYILLQVFTLLSLFLYVMLSLPKYS